MLTWLKKTYQSFVDHLTKALGIIGTTLMSTMAYLDPEAIRIAAQTYLGQHAIEKIGALLFILVIIRGWYTGRKLKQLERP